MVNRDIEVFVETAGADGVTITDEEASIFSAVWPVQSGAAPPGPASAPEGSAHEVPGIHISPTVFKLPSGDINDRLVAVLMPFDAEFRFVYDAIKRSCRGVPLDCKRADDLWEDSVLMQDVFSLIYRSRIVVVDFSTRNPNVFYETGIAHTLGKPVVPIAQSDTDVPFDLRHHRYLRYLNNNEGLRDLEQKLAARLESLAALP